MTSSHPAIMLKLGEQTSKVQITQADGITITYKLAFGLEAMTPAPFRQDPPSALELERAIMVVEDVLMPLAARIPAHELVTLHSPLPLAGELGSHELSRESIEQLFGQFAAMVEGDPLAAAHLPKGRRFAAVLLILREWMHHLDAKRVLLAD
ncbi:hypothetical protein IU367_17980 [Aeromonas bestiarum]|uniref:hypothetical protein n=1 Tax=Aeromonas bestiarum TaxID=105751 RepID=UPI002378D7DD|nr:hypothetical protein [Aeromonas bestiarum]EKP0277871.1 hypothetical protein [Aeromonas bestiarum]WDL81948.1 hypothetical protein IU367_17980 [Aeromonas bestiarum]